MYLLLHECADYSQREQFQSPAACLPAAGGGDRGGEKEEVVVEEEKRSRRRVEVETKAEAGFFHRPQTKTSPPCSFF